MAENLKVTKYNNDSDIPTGYSNSDWINLTTGAYAVYENDELNSSVYGNLYNWFVIDDSRGICPSGWHIPTDNEWKQLEIFLGMNQNTSDLTHFRGTNEGNKLKDLDFGGTDESGFSALGGGYYDSSIGYFDTIGGSAYFWSSTDSEETEKAWMRHLSSSSPKVYRYYMAKNNAHSIRCIKDD